MDSSKALAPFFVVPLLIFAKLCRRERTPLAPASLNLTRFAGTILRNLLVLVLICDSTSSGTDTLRGVEASRIPLT